MPDATRSFPNGISRTRSCKSVRFPVAGLIRRIGWRADIGLIRPGVPILWHGHPYIVRSRRQLPVSSNFANVRRGLLYFRKSQDGRSGRLRCELAGECKYTVRWREYEIVCTFFPQLRSAFPTDCYIIGGCVECSFNTADCASSLTRVVLCLSFASQLQASSQ